MIESPLKKGISKDTQGASKLKYIRFGRISALRNKRWILSKQGGTARLTSSLTYYVRDEFFVLFKRKLEGYT